VDREVGDKLWSWTGKWWQDFEVERKVGGSSMRGQEVRLSFQNRQAKKKKRSFGFKGNICCFHAKNSAFSKLWPRKWDGACTPFLPPPVPRPLILSMHIQ